MPVLVVSEGWRNAFPGANVGMLVMHRVANPSLHPALEQRKVQVVEQLRARLVGQTRATLKRLPTMQAYDAYFRGFGKTYHVLLQLESVGLRGKPMPHVAALVEAMFLAELQNQLLTAGHDLEAIRPPVQVDVAVGGERYTLLSGNEQTLTARDMFMSDGQGVISSVLYGLDRRTRIQPHTKSVFFAVYAPAGIGAEAVRRHLQDIRDHVLLFAPRAQVEALETVRAHS